MYKNDFETMDIEEEDYFVEELGNNAEPIKEIDEDALYERWRDDEVDRLDTALRVLYTDFVISRGGRIGYYKGNPEKFVSHVLENLLFVSRTVLKVGPKSIKGYKIVSKVGDEK